MSAAPIAFVEDVEKASGVNALRRCQATCSMRMLEWS
jgi:hypothetical protein